LTSPRKIIAIFGICIWARIRKDQPTELTVWGHLTKSGQIAPRLQRSAWAGIVATGIIKEGSNISAITVKGILSASLKEGRTIAASIVVDAGQFVAADLRVATRFESVAIFKRAHSVIEAVRDEADGLGQSVERQAKTASVPEA
jgi:hypothetical protein